MRNYDSKQLLKSFLDVKDEVLESMNAKADTMRKTIVDILGEDIGKVDYFLCYYILHATYVWTIVKFW